jgi:hypothetical protein
MSSESELSAMIFHRRKVHPKRVRLGVAKHDDVLGIEGDHKLSAVALKCYQPPRSFHARGQLNLFNHSASISVVMAPQLPLEILR